MQTDKPWKRKSKPKAKAKAKSKRTPEAWPKLHQRDIKALEAKAERQVAANRKAVLEGDTFRSQSPSSWKIGKSSDPARKRR